MRPQRYVHFSKQDITMESQVGWGTYTPLLLEELPISRTQIALLREIASLHANTVRSPKDRYKGLEGCYAGNLKLARKTKIVESTVTKYLTKLKKLGYIKQVYFDGKVRVLKANEEILEAMLFRYTSEPRKKVPEPIGINSGSDSDKSPGLHVRTKTTKSNHPSLDSPGPNDSVQFTENETEFMSFVKLFKARVEAFGFEYFADPCLEKGAFEKFKTEQYTEEKILELHQKLCKILNDPVTGKTRFWTTVPMNLDNIYRHRLNIQNTAQGIDHRKIKEEAYQSQVNRKRTTFEKKEIKVKDTSRQKEDPTNSSVNFTSKPDPEREFENQVIKASFIEWSKKMISPSSYQHIQEVATLSSLEKKISNLFKVWYYQKYEPTLKGKIELNRAA